MDIYICVYIEWYGGCWGVVVVGFERLGWDGKERDGFGMKGMRRRE